MKKVKGLKVQIGSDGIVMRMDIMSIIWNVVTNIVITVYGVRWVLNLSG